MPFVNRLFRQGHLSDDVLTGAIVTGDRPLHLDHCTRCATRAMELGRWLDGLRADANAAADAVFPPERLAVQHTQILRRIEQAEEPVRVLEFPKAPVLVRGVASVRRVSAGWVGLAAAAGLALGVVGGHLSARIGSPETAAAPAAAQVVTPAPAPVEPEPSVEGLFDTDVDSISVPALRPLDENTPRIVTAQYAYLR